MFEVLLRWDVATYAVLQLVAAVTAPRKHRYLVLAPMLLMIPLVVHAIVALHAESNLWPIGLIFGSPLAILWVAVIWFASRRMAKAETRVRREPVGTAG